MIQCIHNILKLPDYDFRPGMQGLDEDQGVLFLADKLICL